MGRPFRAAINDFLLDMGIRILTARTIDNPQRALSGLAALG